MFRLIFVLFCLGTIVSCKPDAIEDPKIPVTLTPYDLKIPQFFPQMNIPSDNPLTNEGVALGRKLFYEKLLSRNNSMSCGSCHNQSLAFSDNERQFSTGIDGIEGNRNAQAIINLGFNLHYFWDGRATTLEEQALEPVPNPIEMHQSWIQAVSKLKSNTDYVNRFKLVFGTEQFDSTHVAKALAQFMRTLISGNSRFDRYRRGEINLTFSELNGLVLFNSDASDVTSGGDCFHCHSLDGGLLTTDNRFHNNGLDAVPLDFGRELVTGDPSDRAKFLTPTLRNVALTAPYMHDGRFNTLMEVVNHYNSGGVASPTIDPLMKNVGDGLNLTLSEKNDLIAFLRALTDSTFLNNPAFSDPN